LPENGKRAGFQNNMRFQEIRRWTKSHKKKIVSFNFFCTAFSLLYFLTLEYGTESLSQNISVELPICAAQYLKRAQILHDLAMQALVWLHISEAERCSLAQSGLALHTVI
jgi:hypothetical protein